LSLIVIDLLTKVKAFTIKLGLIVRRLMLLAKPMFKKCRFLYDGF